MTDNDKKEIARAYRIAAKRLREADTVVPALSLEQWAKELDPSRPAPGMVVWFVNPDNDTWCIGRTYDHGIEWGTTSYMWDSIDEWKPAHFEERKEIADRLRNTPSPSTSGELVYRRHIDAIADELDPLRPKAGMFVWWRDCYGPWQRGLSTLTGIVRLTMDGEMQTYGWDEIDYKPARFLAPGEVEETND